MAADSSDSETSREILRPSFALWARGRSRRFCALKKTRAVDGGAGSREMGVEGRERERELRGAESERDREPREAA